MATPTANSVHADDVSTPSYYFDGLLAGVKWGSSTAGTGVILTYSFPGAAATWRAGYGAGEPLSGYAPLDAAQQAAVRNALQAWADAANIEFTQLTDDATTVGELRFAFSAAVPAGTQAGARLPSGIPEAGDLWLNANASWDGGNGFSSGQSGYLALMRGIGYGLGLKYSTEANPSNNAILDASVDGYRNTVMSYSAKEGVPGSSVGFNPTTPMLYDIAAIQYLYGANTSYRTGDDTYTFTQGQDYFLTIWDAGGTDTIVWSGTTQGAVIDLRAGAFSRLGNPLTFFNADGSALGASDDTVAIAYGATIENAVGADTDDLITGNAAANRLEGRGGNDAMDGGAGNDTLNGEDGADTLAGNDGSDVLDGGSGDDLLDGGAGVDALSGGPGDDTYGVDNVADVVMELAGEGNDTVRTTLATYSLASLTEVENLAYTGTGNFSGTGNTLANTLTGGTGSDHLDGGAGDDSLDGGGGTDTAHLHGTRQDFTIARTASGYTVSGPDGSDTLTGIEHLQFDNQLLNLGQLASTGDSDVTGAYFAMFGRAPEPSGYQYWQGQLGTTFTTLGAMIDNWLTLPIVKANGYPDGQTTSEFIRSIYLNVFNKDPDDNGYWAGLIPERGRGTVVADMLAAAQGVPAGTAGKDYVDNKISAATLLVNAQYAYGKDMSLDDLTTLLNEVTAGAGSIAGAADHMVQLLGTTYGVLGLAGASTFTDSWLA